MSKLYIIRHAQIEKNPEIPVGEWGLSKEAAKSVRFLVEHNSLNNADKIYHSPERKCKETAEIIGNILSLPTKVEDNLRELEIKAGYLPFAEFRKRVTDFFDGKDNTYFEDFMGAQRRIVRGIKSIVDSEAGRSAIIVTHGRILMAFYSYLAGYRIGSKEWESIKLPDISVIDLEKNIIESGFFSGMAIVNGISSIK